MTLEDEYTRYLAAKAKGKTMETEKMTMTETIEHKLRAEFAPKSLEVIDESEQHRGHGGYREGGESHFRVVIRADAFAGLSRVARQRAIYKVLKPEMEAQIHALALDVDVA